MAAFCALTVTLGANASLAGQQPAHGTFHQAYPLSANGSVSIDNASGDIQVVAWDRQTVQVDATLCAPSPDQLNALKITAHSTPNALDVTTTYPRRYSDGSFWEWLFSPRGTNATDGCDKQPQVSYVVHLPSHARVTLASVSGDIAASGVTGQLTLRDTSGDVSATDAGDVWAEAVSGDVTVTKAQGRCETDETSGRTVLRDTSGVIAAHSVSGDIRLEQAAGKVGVSSTSGDIDVRSFRGVAQLRTTSGDISLTLVRSTGVALEASTMSGTIKSDVPLRPGAPLYARTLSGDISASFL
jgi:Toastrack DUF4097